MKRRDRIDTAIRILLIALSCMIVVIPLYFTVLNAFKPYPEIAANIAAWPREPTFENFQEAWRRLDFLNVLRNTTIITVLSAAGCVVIAGMTGYWIARHSKEPLINHRYFITIDKSVRESSLFGIRIPCNPLLEAQMGIIPPYQAISSFWRDRPARASM